MDLDRATIEHWFRRRLYLVFFGSFPIPLACTLALVAKSISPRTFLALILVYLISISAATMAIILNARKRLSPSAVDLSSPLDIEEQKRLRRSIRHLSRLEIVLAFALVYGLSVSDGFSWPVLVGCGMSLLIQSVLIRAILRLRKRLKQAPLTG